MGTFTITSSNLNNQYTFKNESVIVNGNYGMDATTSTLQNINGTFYRSNEDEEPGEYIGNFNGYMRDGVVKYSISEMSRRDMPDAWDAIDEIEQNILGTNGEKE